MHCQKATDVASSGTAAGSWRGEAGEFAASDGDAVNHVPLSPIGPEYDLHELSTQSRISETRVESGRA